MGVLKKLGELLFGSPQAEVRDADGIYLYVKCAKCGAPIRIRADRRNDLLRDFDTGEFTLNKEIMDGKCFSLIYASVRFDATYRIVDKEVRGGEFIDWETYQKLAAPQTSQGS
jgi:hypothetical protein